MFGVQERRDLVAKLEEHRVKLMEIVATLDDEAGNTPLKLGDRSPKGQLLHVVEMERHYVWDWAGRARDEDSPDFSRRGSSTTEEAPSVDPANVLTVAELVERLNQQRDLTYRFIAGTSDEEMERVGRNTPFGDLTVHQFLKSVYRHDQMHQDEVLGQESSYVVVNQEGRRL